MISLFRRRDSEIEALKRQNEKLWGALVEQTKINRMIAHRLRMIEGRQNDTDVAIAGVTEAGMTNSRTINFLCGLLKAERGVQVALEMGSAPPTNVVRLPIRRIPDSGPPPKGAA